MKICQKHWDMLRAALNSRGLGEFGAKSGEQALAAMVTDLEGRGAENDFDPLMSCHWMIVNKATERLGLSLMAAKEDGSDKCPICECLDGYEQWWIDGPADAMLQEAKNKGLIPQ